MLPTPCRSASSLATSKDASLTNQKHSARLVAIAMCSTLRTSATSTLRPLRNAASTELETDLAPSASLDSILSVENVRSPISWAALRKTALVAASTVPQVSFNLFRFLSESWFLRSDRQRLREILRP
jgi:hypothetical protein